jgi:hypothetical protein
MKIANSILLVLSMSSVLAAEGYGAVKLSALQIPSTDAAGKIPGVGAHGFRTTAHGGHPCVFVEKATRYSWTSYTMHFHFDYSMNAQISVLAPMKTMSR